ncbi:NERD domain-containing protein [Euzebya sp.]|uniref:NERD domain-containing protein n=1 Tax=Euzebya sp. TaxID=1971409 RepID=UPI0035171A53
MDNTPIAAFVPLYVGDPVTDPGELALIHRLRTDLREAGRGAVLLANFIADNKRQIDLLVIVNRAVLHVEVKAWSAELPVIGTPNQWAQQTPDGRLLERTNAGRQALDAKYAIADEMRRLTHRAVIDGPDVDFKRHFNAAVVMWEQIPAGSQIEPPRFVEVLGYRDLLTWATSDQPQTFPWGPDNWDAYIRHLGLTNAEQTVDPAQAQAEADMAEYVSRTCRSLEHDLRDWVPLPLLNAEPAGHGPRTATLDDIDAAARAGDHVALLGPPGAGKTHLARHVASRHAAAGRLVVWLRATDFDGRLSDLLARSMAPYSTRPWADLCRTAGTAKSGITLIVDGAERLPEDRRAVLLEQLNACTLRTPAGVLLTGHDLSHVETATATTVHIGPPHDDARAALLRVHGAADTRRAAGTFTSPHELALAARCDAALPATATVTDLHETYIRAVAPAEPTRAAVRHIASRMHDQLVSTLRLSDAIAQLERHGSSPATIDAALGCGLLDRRGHRVGFAHELFRDHLIAESLSRKASTAEQFVAVLTINANAPHAAAALTLHDDRDVAAAALSQLDRTDLLCGAVDGHLGDDLRHAAETAIRRELRACADNETAAVFIPRDFHTSYWSGTHRHGRALLHTAGLRLGRFIDEVLELADGTDQLVARQLADLPSSVGGHATSELIGETMFAGTVSDRATVGIAEVLRGVQMSGPQSTTTPWDQLIPLNPSAGPVRLDVAALHGRWAQTVDVEALVELVNLAWSHRMYHLRLNVLWAAQQHAQAIDTPAGRSAIAKAVSTLPTNHMFLTSTQTEVLATFGALTGAPHLDDLVTAMRDLTGTPDAAAVADQALDVLGLRFEPEEIVGPVDEAFQTLDEPSQLELLLRAAQADSYVTSFWAAIYLREIVVRAGHANPDHQRRIHMLLTRLFTTPIGDTPNPSGDAELMVTAAQAAVTLQHHPALPADADEQQRRSHALLTLLSEPPDDLAENCWAVLDGDRAAAGRAVILLGMAIHDRTGPLEDLITGNADRIRPLLHAALEQHLPRFKLSRCVRLLRHCGDRDSIALIKALPMDLDPEAGQTAVHTIRQINDRLNC